MVEVEDMDVRAPAARKKHLGWLFSVFFRPTKAMHEVASEEKPAWLLPMLLLTALTLISVIIAGPLRREAALNAPFEPPESFQWMTPEQQEQYMQAQRSGAESARTHVFPAIGSLSALWLGWFLLGGILHLVLTMLGSRSTNTTIYNIVAWASLPFAIRLVVQVSAMLSTRRLITSPGLAGFMAADAEGVLAFMRVMLMMVDLYLLWQILLLWLGASSTSGLTRLKALGGVLISIALLLAVSAIPGFLMRQFSQLSITSPFFFY